MTAGAVSCIAWLGLAVLFTCVELEFPFLISDVFLKSAKLRLNPRYLRLCFTETLLQIRLRLCRRFRLWHWIEFVCWNGVYAVRSFKSDPSQRFGSVDQINKRSPQNNKPHDGDSCN